MRAAIAKFPPLSVGCHPVGHRRPPLELREGRALASGGAGESLSQAGQARRRPPPDRPSGYIAAALGPLAQGRDHETGALC
eukprot:794603-Pyramimonas_sp.AAC.1